MCTSLVLGNLDVASVAGLLVLRVLFIFYLTSKLSAREPTTWWASTTIGVLVLQIMANVCMWAWILKHEKVRYPVPATMSFNVFLLVLSVVIDGIQIGIAVSSDERNDLKKTTNVVAQLLNAFVNIVLFVVVIFRLRNKHGIPDTPRVFRGAHKHTGPSPGGWSAHRKMGLLHGTVA